MPEAEWLAALTPSGPAAPSRSFLVGRHGDRIHLVEHERIRFIREDGDDVVADTAEGAFRIAERLYEAEALLRPEGFVRVGKSLIVNIGWIAEIIPWFGSRLRLKIRDRDEELEVARKFVKSFRDYLGIRS
jgi:two-component system, LytTR family, response regulator